MSTFHDIRFPLSLAFGASGGPEWATDIVDLASGREYRSCRHAASRRRYNVGAGIRSLQDTATLCAFFEARQGRLYGFRFRDPVDHRSSVGVTISATDQIIGTGDGTRTEFQLIKTYADSAGTRQRDITRPVAGTIIAAIDGTPALISTDPATGLITFTIAPAPGTLVTAGYEFDVPVRFDIDHLDISLEAVGAGQVNDLPLLEVMSDA